MGCSSCARARAARARGRRLKKYVPPKPKPTQVTEKVPLVPQPVSGQQPITVTPPVNEVNEISVSDKKRRNYRAIPKNKGR